MSEGEHSQSFDLAAGQPLGDYDTFKQNLELLKVSKTFQELDIVKRKWLFENQMKNESQTGHKQRAIKQMPAIVAKSEISLEYIPEVPSVVPDSRFTKLNQKAEEMKKVNLFYLKDILIKPSSTQEERLECLWKIKRNVQKPVFGMALKALVADFLKIPDLLIQMELLATMQSSNHYSLLHPLKELLRYHRAQMDETLVDEVEDTIA